MSDRGAGRSYHHGSLAAAALDAVEQLLDEGGPGAVTVRAVAASVGVTHTALYRHYASRDALLDAVAARFVHRIADAVPPGATVATLLERYCDAAVTWPQRYRLAFDLAVNAVNAPATAGAFTALRDRAGAVFAGPAGRVTRDVVDDVLRTWGTVHGMLDLYWRGMVRARTPQAAAAYVLAAALR